MILLGTDDGAKLWVNGEKVFENRDHWPPRRSRTRWR